MVVDYVGVWSGGAPAVWGGGGPGPTPGPTPTGPAPGPTPTGPAPGPTPTGPAPGPTPTGGGGNRDAYGTIQAESANHLVGLSMEPCGDTGGGQDVGNAANGDYAVYTGVNFGSTPATQFVARAASGAPGGISGLVEVRLDSVGSAPIGSFAIANTGGWQAWRTVPANISGVTGVHTVYITYTSA